MNEPQKNDQEYTEELEKFEETRQRWEQEKGKIWQSSFCKKKKAQRWEREKADIRELVSALREQAAQLKINDSEEFELLYWTTKAHIIRDEIYNTSYAVVISILSLVISIFSMINSIKQGGNVVAVFGPVFALIVLLIVLLIICLECRAFLGGRDRSYYRILYSILEDLRK